MASDEHKIAAPLGIETIALRLNGDERAIHIMAWAEGAWPDYIAVQDRITGRVCTYRPIEGDEIGGGGLRREAIPPSVPAARGRHRDDGRMGGGKR